MTITNSITTAGPRTLARTGHTGLRLNIAHSSLGHIGSGDVSGLNANLTLIGWTGWHAGLGVRGIEVVPVVELAADCKVFPADRTSPAVALVIRPGVLVMGGTDGPIAHLVPVEPDPTNTRRHDDGQPWRVCSGYAASGNYATGDSRFSDLVSTLLGHRFYGAVAIHDHRV